MKKTKSLKKWMTIVPLALMSITMAGLPVFDNPVHAAVAPSFSDVPAGHWTYDAVSKLVKAGIVDGYTDKTFKGDKAMSRYEVAFVVAKAMDKYEKADEANKQLIDKLSAEYASELNRLGARVAKVEAKTNTWISGETRFRYVSDNPTPANGKKLRGADNIEFRQRIKFGGTINENTSFFGRIATAGGNKLGNSEYSSGSEIALDTMHITSKNLFGLDSVRVGRSAIDSITNGLIGKPNSADGIAITDTWGKVNFKGWMGNIKSNTYDFATGKFTTTEANRMQTAQVGFKPSNNLTFNTGYYWADVPGTSAPNGMGTLNTSAGKSFDGSKGWTASAAYKMGKYTLLADYVSTKLNGAVNLPTNPKGWALQLSNSKGPAVLYPAVNLVNPANAGDDAWMVSYRSVDAGTIPSGAGGYDTTAVANPGQPYSVFTHTTDNVNVLYFAYQKVVAKNVLASFEYQDIKLKNKGLTDLPSNQLDKTYMLKLEYFY